MKLCIFSDGASKGNPGKSSIGVVAFKLRADFKTAPSLLEFKDNPNLAEFTISEQIGIKTNNQAEYMALLAAHEYCLANNIFVDVFYLDSELVVKQINGIYKVKNENMKPLYQQVKRNFTTSKYLHVRREYNAIADYLANEAFN